MRPDTIGRLHSGRNGRLLWLYGSPIFLFFSFFFWGGGSPICFNGMHGMLRFFMFLSAVERGRIDLLHPILNCGATEDQHSHATQHSHTLHSIVAPYSHRHGTATVPYTGGNRGPAPGLEPEAAAVLPNPDRWELCANQDG